ncbi:MAG: VanZ family protein [Hyphomicrobiales bacterium]|nr:VanZ family protein [Hyphomicrobiales bacterium]
MQRLFQVAGWLLALTIVVLSVSPPGYRPVTGAGQSFEHLGAFLATGACFGFGYPGRWRLLVAALILYAGSIELAQVLVPGRHARLLDFLTDAFAAAAGLGLAHAVLRLIGGRGRAQ